MFSFKKRFIFSSLKKFSIDFIKNVWKSFDKVNKTDLWREQRAIIMNANKPKYEKYILYVPQISINAYPNETNCIGEREWTKGDFVLHFANNHNKTLYFKYLEMIRQWKRNELDMFDTSNWLNVINEWRLRENKSSIFVH